jgi:hypothetical protein
MPHQWQSPEKQKEVLTEEDDDRNTIPPVLDKEPFQLDLPQAAFCGCSPSARTFAAVGELLVYRQELTVEARSILDCEGDVNGYI